MFYENQDQKTTNDRYLLTCSSQQPRRLSETHKIIVSKEENFTTWTNNDFVIKQLLYLGKGPHIIRKSGNGKNYKYSNDNIRWNISFLSFFTSYSVTFTIFSNVTCVWCETLSYSLNIVLAWKIGLQKQSTVLFNMNIAHSDIAMTIYLWFIAQPYLGEVKRNFQTTVLYLESIILHWTFQKAANLPRRKFIMKVRPCCTQSSSSISDSETINYQVTFKGNDTVRKWSNK